MGRRIPLLHAKIAARCDQFSAEVEGTAHGDTTLIEPGSCLLYGRVKTRSLPGCPVT